MGDRGITCTEQSWPDSALAMSGNQVATISAFMKMCSDGDCGCYCLTVAAQHPEWFTSHQSAPEAALNYWRLDKSVMFICLWCAHLTVHKSNKCWSEQSLIIGNVVLNNPFKKFWPEFDFGMEKQRKEAKSHHPISLLAQLSFSSITWYKTFDICIMRIKCPARELTGLCEVL